MVKYIYKKKKRRHNVSHEKYISCRYSLVHQKYACITLTVLNCRFKHLCINKLVFTKLLFHSHQSVKFYVCFYVSMNLKAITANIYECSPDLYDYEKC